MKVWLIYTFVTIWWHQSFLFFIYLFLLFLFVFQLYLNFYFRRASMCVAAHYKYNLHSFCIWLMISCAYWLFEYLLGSVFKFLDILSYCLLFYWVVRIIYTVYPSLANISFQFMVCLFSEWFFDEKKVIFLLISSCFFFNLKM